MKSPFSVLLATVALAAAATAPAAEPESWVCVPGEDGRWRCAEGNVEPETSPLPALREPGARTPSPALEEAERSSPSIFILDRPSSRVSPLELPAPVPGAGGPPLLDSSVQGAFALKIASVSRVEEIPAFVESFGLDPRLVRFVPIEEAGASRQVIMWGAFASAEQARRAIAGLPSAVRSMRPQVVRADGFVSPPLALLAVDQSDHSAVAPGASVGPVATPAASSPEPAGPPVQREAAERATATTTAPETLSTEPVAAPAETPALPRTVAEASLTPPAPEPSSADPSAPVAVPVETPPRLRPAANAAVTPAAPEPGSGRPDDQAAPPQPPPPRPTAAVTPGTPVAGASARPASGPPPGHGSEAFRQLADDAYTVQLTSLREASLIGRYLHRHQLDPDRIYRLRLDEGAGPRWLVLWGAYPSLERAERARAALPASVRSPWVRRVEPLQARLSLQSDL